MNVLETIYKRRSIRKYSEEPITEDIIHQILTAGLLAPTSMNRKPCEFYVIQDKEVLKKLSKAKKLAAGMLAECNTAIAVFGDSKKADTWIEDCSIAMSYMSLTATDLGVGNCWCQIHLRSSLLGKDAEENVRSILNIQDKQMRIVGILALGIAEQQFPAYTDQDIDWNKVHRI